MNSMIDRRTFLAGAGAALGAAAPLSAQPKRALKIGHTGITWGFKPEDATAAIADVGGLGYNPLSRKAWLGRVTAINYILCARKPA